MRLPWRAPRTADPQRVQRPAPTGPSNSTRGIRPRQVDAETRADVCTPVLTAAQLPTAKTRSDPRGRRRINKHSGAHADRGPRPRLQEEGRSGTGRSADEGRLESTQASSGSPVQRQRAVRVTGTGSRPWAPEEGGQCGDMEQPWSWMRMMDADVLNAAARHT